jgi:hypothetical protein
MRKSLSFVPILMLACSGLPLAGQMSNVPEGQAKGFETLNPAALQASVSFLASDKLAGRMSLQPSDASAVQWIAGQFGKAGLDPIATKANGMPSYEQSFNIIEYRPDRAATAMTLSRGGKTTVWHAPDASGAYKTAVDVTAPVVFAGYGITAPELNYDDYTNLNAKGKIVLIFDHEPQETDPQSVFNGTGNTRYATTRVKVLNAQAHGAVAVILVAEPNRKHLTNAERAAKIGGSITRATPLPLQAIAQDEVMIPYVLVLDDVAKELLATSGTTGSSLQSLIDSNLKAQSLELPDTTVTIHLHNLSETEGRTSNVVGLLKGSDPKLKAETIIISAHHDHDGSAKCPDGEPGTNQDGQPTAVGADCEMVWHGADDNASGTAGVIALAKAFAANGVAPKRSILFVVFAAEERGLLGSYWMAAHPLRPLATTRAMINFDMIGRDEKASPQTDGLIEIPEDNTNRLNLIGALYSPDYFRVVAQSDNGIGLTLDSRFDHDSALNVLFRSDQFPFLLHNVPAFWWFTGFHPDYHHVTDTAEKLDYAKMTKILQLAYLSAWRFGSDEEVPAFVANPQPPAPPVAEAPAAVPAVGAAEAPAAEAEPVRRRRPIKPVTIITSTGQAGAAVSGPPVGTPITVVPVEGVHSVPVKRTPDKVPDFTPTTLASPTVPATAKPGSPSTRPPVAPVAIRPAMGADPDAVPGEPTTIPVAPVTTAAPESSAPDTAITPSGVTARPPVAPIAIAPVPGTPEPGVKPPVTPVKLGGKQPGQDEYEDPK